VTDYEESALVMVVVKEMAVTDPVGQNAPCEADGLSVTQDMHLLAM
jgi:hypothetical protein